MAVLLLPDENSQPKTFCLLENEVGTVERSVKNLAALSRHFLLVAVQSFTGLEKECLHCWEIGNCSRLSLHTFMCHRASDFPEMLLNLSILHVKKQTLRTSNVWLKVTQQSAMELKPNALPPCHLPLSLVLASGQEGGTEGGRAAPRRVRCILYPQWKPAQGFRQQVRSEHWYES